jgi:multiple sugar transport system substrate-binding protein
MRSAASAVLAIGLAAIGAVGCGTAPGTGTWPPESHSTRDVTITILSGSDASASVGNEPVQKGDESGMYQELADWWNKYERPSQHITIKLDAIPGGATTAHSEMLAAAEYGETGYDIYNLDNEWVSEFADSGYIRSLQGKFRVRVFLPEPLRSGEDATGRLYAAPFTTDVGLLYYRTGLVQLAQIRGQHTFEDLLTLAQHVTTSPQGRGLTDYVGQFDDYEGLTVNILEIIHGYDSRAFAGNGTISNSGAVTAGLRDVLEAFRPPYGTAPAEMPTAELDYQEGQALTEFADGHAVFMRNWPIYYTQLADSHEPDGIAKNFNVTALPFPSVLGGQDLAISADSPHPNQALDVIRFLTSAQAERCLFAVGGFPATRSGAYNKGRWLPTGYLHVRGHSLCGTQTDQELRIAKPILAGIRAAIPRPVTRYYTEFSTTIQTAVSRWLARASRGDVDVSGLVSAITAGVNAASTGRVPPSTP